MMLAFSFFFHPGICSLFNSELRDSLDILRAETEKQAENHLELANQIRVDLEAHTAEFHSKQVTHRRTIQAPLERKFKEKQVQESYVKKSREKYEGDCMRIESYTQQATYMQGIDLAKVQQKLSRTRQTIQGNERDYAKFSKDLLDLLVPWEKEWKDYCDSCQDLEEERMDFMKDIIWIYVNLVSTICVHDDQVRPHVSSSNSTLLISLFSFSLVRGSGRHLTSTNPKKTSKTSSTCTVLATKFIDLPISSKLVNILILSLLGLLRYK